MPTVDVRLKKLRGAARARYLEKWERILKELYKDKYQDIVGNLERFLLERCSGLEDSECYSELASEVMKREITDDDFIEQVCRYHQYLKESLGYETAQDALKDYEKVDDPDRLAAIEQFLEARFQCLYQYPFSLETSLITNLGVTYDYLPTLNDAIDFAEARGYTAGRFRDVWGIFPMERKYLLILTRERPKPCVVFHSISNGIIWVATCSYLLINDRKRIYVAYEYK